MITITKDKIYSSPFTLKSTSPDSDTVNEIGVDEVLFSLGEDVEFGEDLTFSRLFDIIIFHKDFFNILFNAELRGAVIEDFINDYEKVPNVVYDNQEYKLRLSWVCDLFEYEGNVDLIDYIAFDAFGRIDKNIDKNNYGISIAFSSLGEIKDNLIFIDKSIEVYDSSTDDSELDAILKANYKPTTLYQIISSILHEISFYGKPEDRDAQRIGLLNQNEEIERWIQEGTLDEHTKNWDAIKDDIDEMIDQKQQQDDKTTFWDVLYPNSELTSISSQDEIDNVIIALSEGSDTSLEEQLQEAHDSENYEKAARLKKLIDKRDGNLK